MTVPRVLLTVVACASLSPLVRAQGRTEVTINDTGVQAENLTSSQDGALRSFDLKSGAAKGIYPFPTNGGVCNDMAVASDGTVYATESFNNRIHRLRPGATALDVWITDPQLAAVDDVALLADGAVYVNTFFGGRLFRIQVNADGSAGTIVAIETSMPLNRPDRLRTVGPQTLIQAEGQGRVAELTIKGNRAEVRVLQEGLTAATGVTVVGNSAFVIVERAKASL